MRHPELIVIFIPGDATMHIIGCHYQFNEWTYSKPVIMPENELDGFVGWRMTEGMTLIDVREKADLHTPGMSAATPVLLFKKGFDTDIAMQGYTMLHRAILRSEAS